MFLLLDSRHLLHPNLQQNLVSPVAVHDLLVTHQHSPTNVYGIVIIIMLSLINDHLTINNANWGIIL